DLIETAIEVLSAVPPKVHLKVSCFEIPENETRVSGWNWYDAVFLKPDPIKETDSTNLDFYIEQSLATSVLTDSQARVVTATLERSGLKQIHDESLITSSGRQTQIQFTNRAFASEANLEAFHPGSLLELVPCVSADGKTIQMTLIPRLIEFPDFEEPRQSRYRVRIRQITASPTLVTGQTVVLGVSIDQLSSLQTAGDVPRLRDGTPITGILPLKFVMKRRLVFFITPTIELE
ncbi:MAG: hypothetical protein QOJ15_1977, partial [Bradyrhizobium sp.]|nr:hypothetical protein [Bradyrhizobium sp.]